MSMERAGVRYMMKITPPINNFYRAKLTQNTGNASFNGDAGLFFLSVGVVGAYIFVSWAHKQIKQYKRYDTWV